MFQYFNTLQPQLRVFLGKSRLKYLLLSIISTIITIKPVIAAERIYAYYGPVSFSVSVKALDKFAQDGTIDKELGFYLKRFSPEKQAKFRNLLQAKLNVNYTDLYHFFNSDMAESLLVYIGELIQIKGGSNGIYGIRAALVKAAASDDGLSIVSFLHQFPTDIEINTGRILKFVEEISTLADDNRQIIASLREKTTQLANSEAKVDLARLPNLQQLGTFSYRKQTITLRDRARQRDLITSLHLPELQEDYDGKIPVIVISNGLGVKLDRYDYLAQYLASHGLAVVTVQHPGSDHQQQQDFLAGLAENMFEFTDFVDRPKDVTFVLDQLESLNQSQFKNRLNLEEVGIFGNSFGGDTALALAGAEIDFTQLEKDCNAQYNLINLSLLVQCQALKLPRESYNLRDSRIKAAFVLFPGVSSSFGQNGISKIQIPVFWGAVSKDVFSPLALEQITSFNWLTSPDKYLAVVEGVEHTSLDFRGIQGLQSTKGDSLNTLFAGEPEIVKDYLKSFNLAFFQVYLGHDTNYLPYLTASYSQYLSQSPHQLSFVKSEK